MIQRLRTTLLATTPALSAAERLYATLSALVGIALCIWALDGLSTHTFWLLAPMGASAIILFGMPNSPVAQPWPVIGSYLCALIAGFVSAHFIPSPILAAGIAVGLCLWLMARFNCIHPPGGALALLIVFDQKTFMSSATHTLELVGANVGLLVLMATLINNLIPGRRYPHRPAPANLSTHETRDLPPIQRGDLNHDDLITAMQRMDTFIDIREDELVKLYQFAIDHAFDRHIGLHCVDVMSTDVITTVAQSTLGEAWELLQRHKIKALPVIDENHKLTGIVTLSDFFRVASSTPDWLSTKVSHVMTTQVFTAAPATHMADLVKAVASNGRHHIPVLDDQGKVIGMLTQSDMISALYHRLALQKEEAESDK